jgi:hypothetical protein
VATPNSIIEGFSVSHAAILSGTATPSETDIYGIREGTLDVDTDSYDNTGDDAVLSSWSWINFATLSIKSGYIPFDMIALLSGSSVTTSGSTDATISYKIPLWNAKSMNQIARPVLIRVPSKDSLGNQRNFDIVLFKVQFSPITFDGPTYKDGMACNYGGKALLSSVDETGTVLAEKAIGRLLSGPTT